MNDLWRTLRYVGWVTPVAMLIIIMACGGPTQVADSPAAASSQGAVPTPQPVPPGGSGTYANGYALPAVTAIYSITVEVMAAPGQITQFSFQGDIVTLLCREDQEFVAPAGVNEIPTLQSRTRELDNCRMLHPRLRVQK